MNICKNMTPEDYEQCYSEALLILTKKYDEVGVPYERNGQRVCKIETLLLDDRTVFVLAWGPKVADEIEYCFRKTAVAAAS